MEGESEQKIEVNREQQKREVQLENVPFSEAELTGVASVEVSLGSAVMRNEQQADNTS